MENCVKLMLNQRYKFNSDDEFPINKSIEILIMTIIVRAVFQNNNKYHLLFSEMNVYINYK